MAPKAVISGQSSVEASLHSFSCLINLLRDCRVEARGKRRAITPNFAAVNGQ